MNRKISRVNLSVLQKAPKKKRVAAYARVSCGRDAMLHSLSAQVSYYSTLIQGRNDWEFVCVYVDEALSGTRDSRGDFQRMLADCRAGKIDMIITKSISRFARNTITTLTTIRELSAIGVDVYFEEQNIHTLGEEGELVLTLLAAYAEEEARSVSQNIRWHIESNFKQGLLWVTSMYGFQQVDSRLEIVEEEAEMLRRAADIYLAGGRPIELERAFAEAGVVGKKGKPLTGQRILKLLLNEKVSGDTLLQKTFTEDPITKIKRVNEGERPQYYAENSHEAIIDKETYKEILAVYERRKSLGDHRDCGYGFTSRIVCGKCGAHYTHRSQTHNWACSTSVRKGKNKCNALPIPEDILQQVTTELLGIQEFDGSLFREEVKEINVQEHGELTFTFFDGRIETLYWKSKEQEGLMKYPFSGRIICDKCGSRYMHRKKEHAWSCRIHVTKGNAQCTAKPLSEKKLKWITAEVLGIEEFDANCFREQIKEIRVSENRNLSFKFHDGRIVEKSWISGNCTERGLVICQQ